MERNVYLKRACESVGIFPTEKQVQQLLKYYEILTEWNRVMNLTAITEFEDVVLKHFADSFSLHRICDLTLDKTLLDVGTGAGFPGIPLKIVFPQLRVTLLDSLNKRIKFLDHVIAELGLYDITAIHGRAEDYARREEYREQFDLCVSRAVANLASLSEYCIPYVKTGGCFIAYKSGKSEEEIQNAERAINLLGGSLRKVEEFILPGSDISRCFVIVEKVKETKGRYPRKAGVPGKEPL